MLVMFLFFPFCFVLFLFCLVAVVVGGGGFFFGGVLIAVWKFLSRRNTKAQKKETTKICFIILIAKGFTHENSSGMCTCF